MKKNKEKRKIDLRVEKAKIRQRPLLKKVVEEGRKIIEAGREIEKPYGKNYLRGGRLTKTKAWQEALEEEISDRDLLKVHKGLLIHKDWRARDAGLDKGYKIKKRYTNGIKITSKWAGKSKEEIIEFIVGDID